MFDFSEYGGKLKALLLQTFGVWDRLYLESHLQSKPCSLSFSGGKDSHAVLLTYLAWCDHSGKTLDLSVVFSDTELETELLYSLIDSAAKALDDENIRFIRAKAPIRESYWFVQFALGYPVPDYRVRWCTKHLKIIPIDKALRGAFQITGVHFGESTKRDLKINNNKCETNECGISDIKKAFEPIREWRNCHVWDFILLFGDRLYPRLFAALEQAYAKSEDALSGSMRMGCAICPVIAFSTLKDKVNSDSLPEWILEIRELLEVLRSAPRLRSERVYKKSPEKHGTGALSVDVRRYVWDKLKPFFPQLISKGWLTSEQISLVESALESRQYPKTYKLDWILQEEALINEELIIWQENPISYSQKNRIEYKNNISTQKIINKIFEDSKLIPSNSWLR